MYRNQLSQKAVDWPAWGEAHQGRAHQARRADVARVLGVVGAVFAFARAVILAAALRI